VPKSLRRFSETEEQRIRKRRARNFGADRRRAAGFRRRLQEGRYGRKWRPAIKSVQLGALGNPSELCDSSLVPGAFRQHYREDPMVHLGLDGSVVDTSAQP
jgi:hypothetical protein